MKYYSEVTKKIYDTETDLKKAEKEMASIQEAKEAEAKKKLVELEKTKELRATEAKEIAKAFEEAKILYDQAKEAYKNANGKMTDFINKYGTYHQTFRRAPFYINHIFDDFFVNTFKRFFS